MTLRRLSRRFWRHRGGLAFVEFALVSPFLFLLLFGAIELTRYMLIVQRVEKTAYTMSDLVDRYTPATHARLQGEIDRPALNNVVFAQFARLMEPYESLENGSVVVASLRKEAGVIRIKWQAASPGGLSRGDMLSSISGLRPREVNHASASLRNRAATISPDIAAEMNNMLGYENMIVTEVFYRYRPLMAQLLGGLEIPFTIADTTLARRVYSRSREGNLICLPPNFIYDECMNRVSSPVTGCSTVTGPGSCTDECGNCRSTGSEWCTADNAGSPRRYMRCVNGLTQNQNQPDYCVGAGSISCD